MRPFSLSVVITGLAILSLPAPSKSSLLDSLSQDQAAGFLHAVGRYVGWGRRACSSGTTCAVGQWHNCDTDACEACTNAKPGTAFYNMASETSGLNDCNWECPRNYYREGAECLTESTGQVQAGIYITRGKKFREPQKSAPGDVFDYTMLVSQTTPAGTYKIILPSGWRVDPSFREYSSSSSASSEGESVGTDTMFSAEVSGSPFKGVVDIEVEAEYQNIQNDAKGVSRNHSSWRDLAFKIDRLPTLVPTQRFREAVAALPTTFDVDSYSAFVDEYGDSIVKSVQFGVEVALLGISTSCTRASSNEIGAALNVAVGKLGKKSKLGPEASTEASNAIETTERDYKIDVRLAARGGNYAAHCASVEDCDISQLLSSAEDGKSWAVLFAEFDWITKVFPAGTEAQKTIMNQYLSRRGSKWFYLKDSSSNIQIHLVTHVLLNCGAHPLLNQFHLNPGMSWDDAAGWYETKQAVFTLEDASQYMRERQYNRFTWFEDQNEAKAAVNTGTQGVLQLNEFAISGTSNPSLQHSWDVQYSHIFEGYLASDGSLDTSDVYKEISAPHLVSVMLQAEAEGPSDEEGGWDGMNFIWEVAKKKAYFLKTPYDSLVFTKVVGMDDVTPIEIWAGKMHSKLPPPPQMADLQDEASCDDTPTADQLQGLASGGRVLPYGGSKVAFFMWAVLSGLVIVLGTGYGCDTPFLA